MFTLMQQAVDYNREGLPEHAGLIASGIMMRTKTKETVELCKKWWEEVEKYTERDQPCFTYALWKNPTNVIIIDWDYTKREEFLHVPHVHKVKQRENRFKSLRK